MVVWWMRLIYELFFVIPYKHPNFWSESGEWYTMKNRLVSIDDFTKKCENFDTTQS